MHRTLALVLAVLVTFLLAPAATPADPKGLRVTLMGHHVGAVLETPGGKVYVLDPGGAAAREDIAPYLARRGVKAIDGIIITHPHIDHFAGVPHLLKKFRVKRLYETGYLRKGYADSRYADNILPLIKAEGVERRAGLQSGDRLNLDAALDVRVLGPPRTFMLSGRTRAQVVNNNSLALWVRHQGLTVLFPGDLAEPGQRALAKAFPREIGNVDVFVLPHHGRRYFDPLLAHRVGRTTPKTRLAFTNFDARPETVRSWRSYGLKVFEAKAHGALTLTSAGPGFVLETERTKLRRRYSADRR